MITGADILRGKMAERRIGRKDMARKLGINYSTYYRKMRSGVQSFTVGEMHKIIEILSLTDEEAASIFLRPENRG